MEEKFYLLENMKHIEGMLSGKQKKFWSLKLAKAKHIHVSVSMMFSIRRLLSILRKS